MLDFLVSLLYPKRCVGCGKSGAYVCDSCFAAISFLEYQLCAVCQKGSIDGLTHPKCRTRYGADGIFSCIAYRGIVKKLLYQFKYPPYLSSLKEVLGSLFYEGLIQQEAFVAFVSHKDTVLTCVPLHSSRLKKRGYNQSDLLARDLALRLKIPYVSNLLIRKINTKPQFELKKEERQKNIIGAFEVNKKFDKLLHGKRVVIVDDILTTGSTIRECAKVLKRGGAQNVLGVTLAHEG